MLRIISGLIFCALFLSCTSQIRLISLNPSITALPDAASQTVADVKLLVEAQAWSGDPAILTKIIPVRMTIQNKSGNLVRVRTSEFSFISSSSGKRYAALPPYNIKGSIEKPFYPGFSYDHFLIAPYYQAFYPDMVSCPDDFTYDQPYYDTYYPDWVRYNLPTKEMLRLALPDGVVDVGGYVSGFLYFEKIPLEEHDVKLVAKLINAVNGDLMGVVNIPFKVVKK